MMVTVKILRADGGVSTMYLTEGANPQQEFEEWQKSADPAWLPAALSEVKESGDV